MNNTFKIKSLKIPVCLLVSSVLYLLVIIASRNIPMFWDMGNISWASNLIYDSHFKTFIFPNADIDQGAVPLYSGYVAFLWLIFGKSLFVSHLAILPFVIGTLHYLLRFIWQVSTLYFVFFFCLE